MEKKKVLMVACNNLGNGGVQSVIMSIVRNLSNSFQFDILCFDEKKAYYDDEFESYGGKIYRIPFYNGRNKFRRRLDFYIRYGRLCRGAKKMIRNGNYSVIHCHNGIESGIFLHVAEKYGVPVRISHAHTAFNNRKQYNFIRKIYSAFLNRLMIRNATKLIGCSELACSAAFGDHPSEVVLNSVDFEKFDRKKYEEVVPAQPVLLQVGLFSDNKNQLFSIDVLQCLKKHYPQAKLILAGKAVTKESEAYYAAMQDRINDRALSADISIFSHNAEIPELMSRASYFLFPSRHEGLGIALVEAQCMGLRCFASDSVSKSADAGGCVFLPLGDGAKAWAEEICRDFERTQGKHGSYDCSSFSAKKIMTAFQNLYNGENDEQD